MHNLQNIVDGEIAAMENVLPVCQCLSGILGIRMTGEQIVQLVKTPQYMISDPAFFTVRAIAERVWRIYETGEPQFYMDARTLWYDIGQIDFTSPKNFTYNEHIANECGYAVPAVITKNTSLYEFLQLIQRWKNTAFIYPHGATVYVALLLNFMRYVISQDHSFKDRLKDILCAVASTYSIQDMGMALDACIMPQPQGEIANEK